MKLSEMRPIGLRDAYFKSIAWGVAAAFVSGASMCASSGAHAIDWNQVERLQEKGCSAHTGVQKVYCKRFVAASVAGCQSDPVTCCERDNYFHLAPALGPEDVLGLGACTGSHSSRQDPFSGTTPGYAPAPTPSVGGNGGYDEYAPSPTPQPLPGNGDLFGRSRDFDHGPSADFYAPAPTTPPTTAPPTGYGYDQYTPPPTPQPLPGYGDLFGGPPATDFGGSGESDGLPPPATPPPIFGNQ